MTVRKIKWSSLLHYAELDFEPEAPKQLEVSDELVQSLAWLTAATRRDRRILRCTEQGHLLVADAWSGLNSVETDELHPGDGSPDNFIPTIDHKGVLIATSTQLVKMSFVRKSGEDAEDIYVPANSYYWYPHKIYSVTATVVPASGGTANYVGVTCYI